METRYHQVVFFVLGSTGSGKTSVAVAVAKELEKYNFKNVVIVNCDVSQFYDALPIGTNKGCEEEFQEVPHIFLGFLRPDGSKLYASHMPYPHKEASLEMGEDAPNGMKKYNIIDYEAEVTAFIDHHFRQHKKTAVIICGGTCYYAQSILFTNTTTQSNEVGRTSSKENPPSATDSNQLWDEVRKIDPETASRYHPHDTRRLKRLLDIFYETGERPSDVFKSKNVRLRYPNSFVLGLSIDKQLLRRLIDSRVDRMVERGLLREVKEFHAMCHELSFFGSITESIGYKEFRGCIEVLDQPNHPLVLEALQNVKSNTWRYARQQEQFIRNRLLLQMQKADATDVRQFVTFDVTHTERMGDCVATYLQCILQEKNTHVTQNMGFPLLMQRGPSSAVSVYNCPVCNMMVSSSAKIHEESKRHRGAVKRQRLEEEQWEKYGRILPPRKERREQNAKH